MTPEQIAQIGYDCVLPSAIFFNENLCPSCIKLYAMIRNLTKLHGYCFATNEYLADLLEVDERTIKRQLSALKKEKFLEIHTDKSRIHWQRKIYLSDRFKEKFTKGQNCPPPRTKLPPIKEENSKKNSSSTASPSLARSESIASSDSDREYPNKYTFKLCSLFDSEMKAFNPKAFVDILENTEVFSSMQKENPSIGIEEMCSTIKFLFEMEDPYWRNGIYNARAFKKAFPAILKQMRQTQASQKFSNIKKENLFIAKKVVKHFKMQSKSNHYLDQDQAVARQILSRFIIEKDGVFDKMSNEKVKFLLSKEEFLEKLNKIFEIQFQ